VAYNAANVYPTATALTAFVADASGIMNVYMGISSDTSAYSAYLKSLCYRMVELMIDEEQGRADETGRPVYIPRDYLFERDRIMLNGLRPTTHPAIGVSD
jgi:hypothetical protein